MLLKQLSQGCAVTAAIHGKGSARWNRMTIGHLNHNGSKPPQFFLKQSSRSVTAQCAKAVTTNKFSAFRTVVSRGPTDRSHLHQLHIETGLGDLPSSFCAGKASTDHYNGWSCQMDRGDGSQPYRSKWSRWIRPDCA